MKLTLRDRSRYLESLTPQIILLYGRNPGLVAETAQDILRRVIPGKRDAFTYARLTAEQLKREPNRLLEEACAQSLMGGRRVVHVTGGLPGKGAEVLTELSKANSGDTIIVIEAGDLAKSSALRKAAEQSDSVAAMIFYEETARDLAEFVMATARSQGLTLKPEQVQLIVELTPPERLALRMQIEKIAAVCYAQGISADTLPLEDIYTLSGQGAQSDIFALQDAIFDGDKHKIDQILSLLSEQGTAPVAILRILQNHVQRLLSVKLEMRSGTGLEQALKILSPPLFFKTKPPFTRQLNAWSEPALETVLKRLLTLEAESKSGRFPHFRPRLRMALLTLGRYRRMSREKKAA